MHKLRNVDVANLITLTSQEDDRTRDRIVNLMTIKSANETLLATTTSSSLYKCDCPLGVDTVFKLKSCNILVLFLYPAAPTITIQNNINQLY